jgi:KUP system potassium uptake protein
MAVSSLLRDLRQDRIHRVPGTGVFLTEHANGLPRMLLHNLKHNRVVHEQTWLLTIVSDAAPVVETERVSIEDLGEGLSRVLVRFGFLEYPDLPRALSDATPSLLRYDPMDTSFFLGHDTVVVERDATSSMPRWRRLLFAFMLNVSEGGPAFFRLPPGRVVEIGAQVKL